MRLYIGTYTKLGGKGIYLSMFDQNSGTISPAGIASLTTDPSYLAIHPNGQYLYAVNEEDTGYITAFSIDAGSGQLRRLNSINSGGSAPCHISIDPTGRCALVANYGDGKVTASLIQANGWLDGPTSEAEHYMFGHGPDKSRQMGPHAHCIVPDPAGRFALSCDLGADKIITYHLDAAKADICMTQPSFASVAPGSGPRHIAFDPKAAYAYVVTEMGNTLCAFSYDSEKCVLKPIQVVSTVAEGFHGQNHAAEVIVHKTGKFIFVSNRGEDTIAVFNIDANTGKLVFASRHPCGGKNPRDFIIDPTGQYLVVANQDTNNVVPLKIDQATGALSEAGPSIEVPGAVCVLFAGPAV